MALEELTTVKKDVLGAPKMSPLLKGFLRPRVPQNFSAEIYFCPVPKEKLRRMISGPVMYDSNPEPEYQRLRLLKRERLRQVYNFLAGLTITTSNAAAIEGIRGAYKHRKHLVSQGKAKKGNPIFNRLDEIYREVETMKERLVAIPPYVEESKRLSDLLHENDGIVCKDVQSQLHIQGEDIMPLYILFGGRYGIFTRANDHLDTFEVMTQFLGLAGFGFDHYSWSAEKGEDIFSEHAQDSLSLDAQVDNVSFSMTSTAYPFENTGRIYRLSDDERERWGNMECVTRGLTPIQLSVATPFEDYKTPYAKTFDGIFKALVNRFDHETTSLGDGSILCYFPSKRLDSKNAVFIHSKSSKQC